jgi:hypothetical protein
MNLLYALGMSVLLATGWSRSPAAATTSAATAAKNEGVRIETVMAAIGSPADGLQVTVTSTVTQK